VQRQHADLVILATIAYQLAAAGEEDEVVGAVPLLNHVQPFIDLAAYGFAVEILAEKDRLDCLAEFGKRPVSGGLDVGAGEPAQDRFRLRRAKPERRRIFDHLVVLLADQFPVVVQRLSVVVWLESRTQAKGSAQLA